MLYNKNTNPVKAMVIISRPDEPFIPEEIIVHLGGPTAPAENVVVSFPEYIKNVASSEIYPTWPEDAIRANIHAQINFALNRIFTERYRNLGYDFDITNSKQFDQAFIPERGIFENVSQIVDEIFNSYVVRRGSIEPLYTPYCDGRISTCDGLTQWGTVALAESGYTSYEILQYYYGDDIDIITDVPVLANFESYPLYPLQLGSFGQDVSTIQNELNRISQNFPLIPRVVDVDGIFGVSTEAAVMTFQKIFNLPMDGIVESKTWYKIKYIYNSVKRLSERTSEGLQPEEIESQFPVAWQEGDSGLGVQVLQYYVRAFGCLYAEIPLIEITGYFGPETTEAVIALQKKYNIIVDGVIGIQTWAEFDKDYKANLKNIQRECMGHINLYPGYVLSIGMSDSNVLLLQTFIKKISENYPNIPDVKITGVFDSETEAAVKAIQEEYSIDVTGLVGSVSWPQIAKLYENL
jgi:peptidoglycan hydrolase-like protein with peptidoglycan-binding domain